MRKKQNIYAGVLAEDSPLTNTEWIKGEMPSAQIITTFQQHIDKCLAALILHYGILFDVVPEIESTACTTRDKLIASAEQFEPHSLPWKERIAELTDHRDNCRDCRSLLSEESRQASLPQTLWKILIAVAKEHVPALAVPEESPKKKDDGWRKINVELCIWLWRIHALTGADYKQILTNLMNEVFRPGNEEERKYYQAARRLIPPYGIRGRIPKEGFGTGVITRTNHRKGEQQDPWHREWKRLSSEIMGKGEAALADHINRKVNKQLCTDFLLKSWFIELIESAPHRSEYIEFEHQRQSAEMNGLDFVWKPEQIPVICWNVSDPTFIIEARKKGMGKTAVTKLVMKYIDDFDNPVEKEFIPITQNEQVPIQPAL